MNIMTMKKNIRVQASVRVFLLLTVATFVVCLSGCVDRKLAPEVQHSPEQVEKIRKTMAEFDW